jgi:hypothetical protein
MSKATSGAGLSSVDPACRCVHAGYLLVLQARYRGCCPGSFGILARPQRALSVGSIAYTAPLSYIPTTTTGAAGSSSAAATAGNVKAATTDTSATSGAADTVTLSSNAQRLLAATNNLTALENGGTNLAGVWNADFAQAASIGIDQVPAADAEIAKLPQSDPGHIAQATAAQAFVKANIAAAGTASGGQPVSAPNPFTGASTQTLTAIIGDKSGLYTGYEKAAAAYEYQAQQNSWVNQFGPGNPSNDNAAGKAVYYGKAISVSNALPSLIKASYRQIISPLSLTSNSSMLPVETIIPIRRSSEIRTG